MRRFSTEVSVRGARERLELLDGCRRGRSARQSCVMFTADDDYQCVSEPSGRL
jgi:hypothetical protein